MFRALLMLAAFIFISPAFREHLMNAYAAFDTLVKEHSIIAYAGTGLLGFLSFFVIRMTARD